MASRLIFGNSLYKLPELPDNSVDAIVTDPPYGLSFMGKKWDYDVPSQAIWEECLRVLKPGGYLLAFAGTRTQHRMAVRIEDAGFEIRDMIMWVYGSGFPKSLNIGKAVDKLQGNEREVIGDGKWNNRKPNGSLSDNSVGLTTQIDFKETKGTSEWEGWGTALKPALEPITMARKPLSEKTVAENVLKWGTGGINIDGCRVEANPEIDDMLRVVERKKRITETWETGSGFKNENNGFTGVPENGRFPANLIHDGSQLVLDLFPDSKGQRGDLVGHNKNRKSPNGCFGEMAPAVDCLKRNDSGSAARFFYCAKTSKSERNSGCEVSTNNHPTVKPISLMEYLIKLVSKEGATILDPFMGSGSTGIACKKLKREFIGIEMDEAYIEIAKNRIDGA
jgi:DNA modification methylase